MAKCKIMLLSMLLALSPICMALTFNDVQGDHGNYSATQNFTDLGDNNITGHTTNGWSFLTATVSGNPSMGSVKIARGTVSSTVYTTNSNDVDLFNFITFTLVVSGDLTKSGTGGTAPSYTLTGNRSGYFFIEQDKTIAPVGTNVNFYAKESMYSSHINAGPKASNWSISPTPYKVNGTDYNPPDHDGEISLTLGSTWSAPDAGKYTITAHASPLTNPGSGSRATAEITLVGIDRIEKIASNDVAFMKSISTGDMNYKLCVEKGKTLGLKAFPAGSSSFPENQPVWVSSGSWPFSNYIIGNKEGVDTVTIDTEHEDTDFSITVSCGTSSKKVAISTFNYKYTIFAKSPSNNMPIHIKITGDFDVGHSFWRTEITNNSVEPEDIDLGTYKNRINESWGYYPTPGVNAANDFTCFAYIKNDTGHGYTKKREKIITRSQCESVLNFTNIIASTPGTYTLAETIVIIDVPASLATTWPLGYYCRTKTEKNCTTVAIDSANLVGISLSGHHEVLDSQYGIQYRFIGHSPAKLSMEL